MQVVFKNRLMRNVFIKFKYEQKLSQSFKYFFNLSYKQMRSILIVLIVLIGVRADFYRKYYKQAAQIVKSMTLNQKIGQTVQIDAETLVQNNQTTNKLLIDYSIGSVLIANNCPDKNGNLIYLYPLTLEQRQKVYSEATVQNYQQFTQKATFNFSITTSSNQTYTIKPFFSTDPVHGDHKVAGNVIFPHNIGVSCSHNPQHFYNMGFWAQNSLLSYGFNWGHVPTVAVSHNPQWGRFYQSMGQDHEMIFKYAEAFTKGFQGDPSKLTGVLGTAKHFFGDGATLYGANQGNAVVNSFQTFTQHNIQGFNGSIKAGMATVMSSFSGINFVPLSQGSFMGSILKEDLEFDGFVISDYDAIIYSANQELPTSFGVMNKNQSALTMLLSGVDMFLIGKKQGLIEYVQTIKNGIENNTIQIERLDDAVTKILAVKLAFGVIKKNSHQFSSDDFHQLNYEADNPEKTKQQDMYADSLKAVHESLVLLKNQNQAIPFSVNKLQYIILVGQDIIPLNGQNKSRLFPSYDNIGMQCGGWSVVFQGFNGNAVWSGKNKQTSNASSILDALKKLQKQNVNLVYPNYTDFENQDSIKMERANFMEKLDSLQGKINPQNTLIIGVLGEIPYAETAGDVNIPYCQNKSLFDDKGCMWYQNFYTPLQQINTLQLNFDSFQQSIIDKVRKNHKEIPLLTVLFSGRPMIVNQVLEQSNAFISAFLPGTSGGQGVVDAAFGEYFFRSDPKNDRVNTLSFDWPKSMESLKDFPVYTSDGKIPRIPNPLFEAGYGLSSTMIEKLIESQIDE